MLNNLGKRCDASVPETPGNETRFDCAVGWAGVSLSIFAFGSFALPVKSPQVLHADVGPIVFQMYMSASIVLFSPLVLIIVPWSFTWYGLASAALWVPTSLLSLVAIKFIGISVGQAMWAGATVVVSFVWGVALFQETPSILALALLGLGLVLVGITGLSLCNTDAMKRLELRRSGNQEEPDPVSIRQVSASEDDQLNQSPNEPLIQNQIENPSRITGIRALLLGSAAAVGTGLTNGSMLVPAKLASSLGKEYQGLGFIMSFSIGVLIITSFVSLCFFAITRQMPVFKPRQMLLPAFGTGVMWSIGNLGSIFASQYLGLAVGFSLTQTCLIVAGLWAITLLRELRGLLPIGLWGLSALVVVGGAALLSFYGH